MIKINIGKEEYWIKPEKSQWVIGKLRTATSGKDKGKKLVHGEFFYTTIEGMMRNLLQRKIRCSEFNSIETLQQAVKTCTDELLGMYENTTFK